MSAAPRFRLVILVENKAIQLFSLSQKRWSEWGESLSLSDPVPEEILKEFSGEPALILVSDAHNGHLQITQPNKKTSLDPASLTQLLEEEYDIDTQSYLLGWRHFSVSRDQMQISVSGVERDIVTAATEWLAPLQPKKLWAMPFAWFVSVLKSIDPAFIAVENHGSLLVSHQYLGVDDARSLDLDEVAKYIAARQKERKETHLLYVQASEVTTAALKKKLDSDEITLQTLLPDAAGEPLLAVVSAVLERAQSTLGTLLNFELEVPVFEGELASDVADGQQGEDDSDLDEELAVDEVASVDETEPAEEAMEILDADEVELETSADASLVSGLQPPVPPLQAPVPPVSTGNSTRVAEAVLTRTGASVEVVEDEKDIESPDTETETETDSDTKSETQTESDEENVSDVMENEEADIHDEPTAKAETLATTASKVSSGSASAVQNDVFTQLKGSVGAVHSGNSERYAPVEAKRSWKGPIIVFFVVVILTALVGGGIFWSQQGGQLMGALPSPTPIVTPVPSPDAGNTPEASASASPVPSAAVSKAELKVLVVNATGISGLAGRVSEALGVDGWKNVQASNATGSYKSGATYVTEGLDPAVLTSLAADLDRELTPFAVTETRAAQFDIVVVLAEK